jgi:hypothetical protein
MEEVGKSIRTYDLEWSNYTKDNFMERVHHLIGVIVEDINNFTCVTSEKERK